MATPTTVVVQLVGGRRKELLVPPTANVETLRQVIGDAFDLSPPTLKLVYQGAALPDDKAPLRLKDGDTILVAPTRKPPAAHIVSAVLGGSGGSGAPGRRGAGDSDGDSDSEDGGGGPARLPAGAPRWEVAMVAWLRAHSGLPPLALEWLVFLRPRNFGALALFVAGCLASSRAGVGPVFVLACMVAVILANLGRRREGEESAYSIFNAGVRRLPGQLDADQIDEQIRRGGH
ncbi:hypothetical protein FOA52_000766 [Chlamydomonas sp. UWO 241]|nr:hypothetical protein FOA52_015377 [Chlamydomonas sp. UWO 241]KAG1671094.1 hypothetical protein FOA52_000766 [Chlamydomonas sp. UWO 241]